MLIQVLSPEEKDPSYSGRVNLIDAESGSLEDGRNMRMRITKSRLLAYQDAMRDMTEGIREFSVSRGVEFISVSCDQPIEKMLFGELLKVGIMG